MSEREILTWVQHSVGHTGLESACPASPEKGGDHLINNSPSNHLQSECRSARAQGDEKKKKEEDVPTGARKERGDLFIL